MTTRSVFVAAACLAGGLGLTAAASAGGPQPSILLTVDITSPTAVVISSTGAAALTSSTGAGFFFRLDSALTGGPFNQGNVLTAGLDCTQGTSTYFLTGSANVNNSLTVYARAGGTQVFTAGQQAFSGSSSADLSFLHFAPAGRIGDIYVLGTPNAFETGIIIGQYRIIPAPGAAALLGLGGLVATRRRRA